MLPPGLRRVRASWSMITTATQTWSFWPVWVTRTLRTWTCSPSTTRSCTSPSPGTTHTLTSLSLRFFQLKMRHGTYLFSYGCFRTGILTGQMGITQGLARMICFIPGKQTEHPLMIRGVIQWHFQCFEELNVLGFLSILRARPAVPLWAAGTPTPSPPEPSRPAPASPTTTSRTKLRSPGWFSRYLRIRQHSSNYKATF